MPTSLPPEAEPQDTAIRSVFADAQYPAMYAHLCRKDAACLVDHCKRVQSDNEVGGSLTHVFDAWLVSAAFERPPMELL
jgi:hypothetical protein